MKWVNDISKRAQLGKPPVSGGRSDKLGKVSFENLVFVPAQLNRRPVDYFQEKIDTTTVIGKMSKNPLILKTPVMNAAMSFGALSKEAKIALAKASGKLGTAANTGEGGMLPEERKFAKTLIAQYSTARFGVDDKYLKCADAIEVKIGQGAKPGQGGLLPKEKLTKEIMNLRKLKKIQDVHSPAYHPDINSKHDLRKKVLWLRKITGGKPIIIKLGAGDIEKDIDYALYANPDVIAIDGHSGGTGAAPEIMLNEVGIPTLSALVRARRHLDRRRAKQDLVIGGGINTAADISKAIALGADAVFLGFALMVAMGCIYCRQCPLGKCPVGVTAHFPEKKLKKIKVKKLNIERAVNGIVHFVEATTEEIKMVAGAVGCSNIHNLDPKDLRALDMTTAKISGVDLV